MNVAFNSNAEHLKSGDIKLLIIEGLQLNFLRELIINNIVETSLCYMGINCMELENYRHFIYDGRGFKYELANIFQACFKILHEE